MFKYFNVILNKIVKKTRVLASTQKSPFQYLDSVIIFSLPLSFQKTDENSNSTIQEISSCRPDHE